MDFNLTVLYQLWKKRGSKQDLNSHRYLHMKLYLPKFTEALTVNMFKEDIIAAGTKYQIRRIPGHRVENT